MLKNLNSLVLILSQEQTCEVIANLKQRKVSFQPKDEYRTFGNQKNRQNGYKSKSILLKTYCLTYPSP